MSCVLKKSEETCMKRILLTAEHRYVVESLNLLLDLNLVGIGTYDEAELVLLLGDAGHLLSDQGFDDICHSSKLLFISSGCLQ